jgi:hypothetical protein
MVGFICELCIIGAAFTCLRNELAWHRQHKQLAHSAQRREIALLAVSILTTAGVTALTVMGAGSAVSGFKKALKKFSAILPRIAATELISTDPMPIVRTNRYMQCEAMHSETQMSSAAINSTTRKSLAGTTKGRSINWNDQTRDSDVEQLH